MRRQVVMGLIACMLSSGTTWAQEEAPQGAWLKNESYQSCKGLWLIVPFSVEEWQKLSSDRRAEACGQAITPEIVSREAAYQESRPIRSQKLAIAGLISILAGVAMIIPQGDTYHVFGDAVCVNTYSIDSGSCQSIAPTVGLMALSAGVGMMVIGMQKVDFNASKKSVTATVTWGSKRN